MKSTSSCKSSIQKAPSSLRLSPTAAPLPDLIPLLIPQLYFTSAIKITDITSKPRKNLSTPCLAYHHSFPLQPKTKKLVQTTRFKSRQEKGGVLKRDITQFGLFEQEKENEKKNSTQSLKNSLSHSPNGEKCLYKFLPKISIFFRYIVFYPHFCFFSDIFCFIFPPFYFFSAILLFNFFMV